MILKYDINIPNSTISNRLRNLVNQIYKLLPSREEGMDWEKPLETILEEIVGMYRLMNCGYSDFYFPLLNKLEGLFSLTKEEDFACFRRTIFECLGLMNSLQNQICQLKH